MKDSRYLSLTLAVAIVAAAACAPREGPASDTAVAADAARAANTLNLTASDYAFDAPDSVPAGPTRFVMSNSGKEVHHVIVVRLDSGHTVAELTKAIGPAGPPSWAHGMGGPIGPMPGAPATATTVDLSPGTYALICVIPSSDGVPHMAKGMVRELTVVPAEAAAAATPPVADMTLTLADYSFTPSTPFTAGKHTIRVVNSAQQPHEVVFVRLAPGKTGAEFAAFAEKPEGPPPGELLGGASFIVGSVENFVELELTPGDYSMMCFHPAKDGKSHIAHGMVQDFKVN